MAAQGTAVHPDLCGGSSFAFIDMLGVSSLKWQYWVTLFSVVSSSFVLCWFFHLFVTKYGFYAPFVDNTCMSLHIHSFPESHADHPGFSWLPVIDQTIVAACQVFNLDRAYRIYGRKLWVILAVAPFMYVLVHFATMYEGEV